MVTTTTTISSGVMNRQQADKFIRLAQEDTSLLQLARLLPVNHPSGEINKIGVGSRLLRSHTEAGSKPTDQNPATSVVQYDTVKAMLPYSLSREAVEDNIEGQGIVNAVVTAFAKQFGVDMEDLAINGDTADAGADADFLNLDDGWIKLISQDHAVVPASNKYDHASATIDKSVFSELIKKMPTKYRKKEGLYWIMSPDQYENYLDYLAGRGTALGDNIITGAFPATKGVSPRGIPVVTPFGWPDDKVVLTDPKNLIAVVQRAINVRSTQVSDEVIDKDLFAKWNLTSRFDFCIEEGNALAYAYGVA